MDSNQPKRSKRFKYNYFLLGLNEKERKAHLKLNKLEEEEWEAGDDDYKFNEDERDIILKKRKSVR